MSGGNLEYRVEEAEETLNQHEEDLNRFDERLSSLEKFRQQAIGSLKMLAFMLGSGGLVFIGNVLIGLI